MAQPFTSGGFASVDTPTVWERLLIFSPSTTIPMTALVAVVLLLLPGAAQFDRSRRSVRLLAGISSIAVLVQAVGWCALYGVGTPSTVPGALVDRLLYGLPNYTLASSSSSSWSTPRGPRPTIEPDCDPDDPFRPPPSTGPASPTASS